MDTSFSIFADTNVSLLTDILLSANSGITINTKSALLNISTPSTFSFNDGSLKALGIGSGVLVTSEAANTSTGFGDDKIVTSGFDNVDVNALVNKVFQTQSYDAASLAFDFMVNEPKTTSISIDLISSSNEYSEWLDVIGDSASVMVDDVNYALLNQDLNHSLSVISLNLGWLSGNHGVKCYY